jgi:hypothetical protein
LRYFSRSGRGIPVKRVITSKARFIVFNIGANIRERESGEAEQQHSDRVRIHRRTYK